MTDKPEYITLVHCTQKLRHAVQDDVITLSDQLLEAGLITHDQYIELKNESRGVSERADTLIRSVLNKVQLSPRSYDTFIDILSRESHKYSDILRILSETYSSTLGVFLDLVLHVNAYAAKHLPFSSQVLQAVQYLSMSFGSSMSV